MDSRQFRKRFLPYLAFIVLTVSTASAIMTPRLISERYVGNRSVIIDDVINRRNQQREFLRSVPCIVAFLRTYFLPLDRVSVWYQEDINDTAKLLATCLRIDMVAYFLNGVLKPERKRDAATNVIILTENATGLESAPYFFDLCEGDCSFLTILTNVFEDESTFIAEVDVLVRFMWTRRIMKTVTLARVGDVVSLAGSVSLKPNEICEPSAAVVLSRCENSVWSEFVGITDPSLNNCISNVAFFPSYPYAFWENDQQELGGVEGLLVTEIMNNIGVSLNIMEIEWENRSMIHNEVHSKLDEGVDLVFGGLFWTIDLGSDYTNSYDMVRVVWMIPVTPNVSLRGLVTPFHRYVWFTIGGVLILGGIVKLLLIRDISFLEILALVIGVAVARQPTKFSSRIQFISWTLFGFFLTQFYLGSLADQLINESNLQIESLSELAYSDLKLGGTMRFAQFFNESEDDNDTDETDDVKERIRRNLVIFEYDKYVEQLKDLTNGKNTSFALIVMLNVSSSKERNENYVHIMKENLGNYPLILAARKGLPFLKDINIKMQMLVEAGIIAFWANRIVLNDSYYEEVEDEFESSKLGIEHLAPGFLLLLIGYGMGLCILITEMIVYAFKQFK